MSDVVGFERVLLWSDYRTKKTSPNGDDALTFSGVTYKVSKDSASAEVVFYPDKSWAVDGKTEGADGTFLLGHERGHYKISAIAGRQMQDYFDTLKVDKHFEHNANTTARKIVSKLESVQTRYDVETNHSLNKERQKSWNDTLKRVLTDKNPSLNSL